MRIKNKKLGTTKAIASMLATRHHAAQLDRYPRTITIKYWNTNIGQSITRRHTISDCDGDDLTCEEYYNIQGLVQNYDHDNKAQ